MQRFTIVVSSASRTGSLSAAARPYRPDRKPSPLAQYSVLVALLGLLGLIPLHNVSAAGKIAVTVDVDSNLGGYPGLTNVIAAAAGAQHAVAIREDGMALFWFSTVYSNIMSSYKPVPTDLTNVISVATVWHHGLAAKADGTVATWGDQSSGATLVPLGLSNVTAVAAGPNTSYALRENGTVVGWGSDSSFQINPPSSLTNAMAITAGSGFAAALRSNGVLATWGVGGSSTITYANGLSNFVAIAGARDALFGLRNDGTVWSSANDVPAGLTNVVAIAGGNYRLALKADGTLVKWPGVAVVQGISNVVTLGGGLYSAIALADVRPLILIHPASRTNYSGSSAELAPYVQGTRPVSFQWLRNGVPMPDKTNALLVLNNVQLADAGTYSLWASNAIGFQESSNAVLTVVEGLPFLVEEPRSQVAFPGKNVVLRVQANGSQPFFHRWYRDGQLLSGATEGELLIASISAADEGQYRVEVTNPFGMAASSNALLAVRPVAVWGTNTSRQFDVPLDLTNGVAVSCGSAHTLALTGDGRVFSWGAVSDVPASVSNTIWIAATSGASRNLAMGEDGTVRMWGSTPPPLPEVPLVAAALGQGMYFGLASNGTVSAWAGIGSPSWSNMVAISAGRSHLLGLRRDGIILGHGVDSFRQISGQPVITNAVAVAAGGLFSMALGADGFVYAWGDNRYGQCEVPTNLADVVALAGGDYTAFALRRDGTVVAWGRNDFGQTNVPAGLSNVVAIAAGSQHGVALLGPPELRLRPRHSLTNPQATPQTFCVTVPTTRGHIYHLEGSTDLRNWQGVTSVTGGGVPRSICETQPTNQFRFYRVQEQ